MENFRILRPQDTLSPALAVGILDLIREIWPPDAPAPPPDIEATIADWHAEKNARFLVVDDENENRVLAHARIFPRTLSTQNGSLEIGALAAVCVHPDFRGRGWGADVVRGALDYLPAMNVEAALLQTGVVGFYEKLGCRRVDNRFHDAGNYDIFGEAMIYPAAFAWPEGDIDLNGYSF